jgi:hypothetical protein
MIAAPVTVFILSTLLLLPSDAQFLGKLSLPFLGAAAAFLAGWVVSVPAAIVLGGSCYWFLKSVGYRSRLAYWLAGPVIGLSAGMFAHILAPEIIGNVFASDWSGNAYVFSCACGGFVLMALFWHIRRPDRPWDDAADRDRARALA